MPPFNPHHCNQEPMLAPSHLSLSTNATSCMEWKPGPDAILYSLSSRDSGRWCPRVPSMIYLGRFPHLQGRMDILLPQVQANCDKRFNLTEKQETAVSAFTSELKQHKSQLESLADKVDSHTQQISKIFPNKRLKPRLIKG